MARRTPTSRGVVLSHLEFDLLWEDHTGQRPPYPIEVPSHGTTAAERDELGEQVFAALEQAGLVAGDDIDPGLRELFDLLDRPVWSVDALVFGEKALRVLAARKENQGLLAVLDDQEIFLEPIRDDELVAAMMSVVGDLPGGPGEPVRLPREALSTAMDTYVRKGYDGFERELAAVGITGRMVRAAATLVESKRTCAGQLGANGPGGRSPVLSWYDTSAGRYAVTVEDAGLERLATLTPANGAWMTRRLSAMLDQVAR
ncbi:MAG: ESX secretion-associated protein EspG [Kibdelosporangium sp.]